MGRRGSATLETTHVRGRRLTRKEKQEVIALHVQGLSSRAIAEKMGMNMKTALKVIQGADALMKVGAGERAASLMGVAREELREQQKQVFMARFREATEEACDFMAEAIRSRDAQGFRDVVAALEKVDKISGNTVGEQQASHAVQPVVNIDLRGLIDRVLEGKT